MARSRFALVALPFVVARAPHLDPEHFPIDAARQLTAERVFHDDTTGGYLIYAYGPERQIYIDDRAELFGPAIADFIRTRNADGELGRVFGKTGDRTGTLKKEDPLAHALAASGWREDFADDSSSSAP